MQEQNRAAAADWALVGLFGDKRCLLVDTTIHWSRSEEGSLGPREVCNAEHVVDIKQKERSMGKVNSTETSSINRRQRGAVGSLGRVKDGGRNGVGAKAVAESTGKVCKPVERKEEGVVGVSSVGHGNAHKCDVEAGKSHESDNAAGRVADRVDRGVGPKSVVHDKESKILHHHHGGMEADGGLVGGKRDNGHLGLLDLIYKIRKRSVQLNFVGYFWIVKASARKLTTHNRSVQL